jgi:hypothetical protein
MKQSWPILCLSHTEGTAQTEGVREEGAEENTCS